MPNGFQPFLTPRAENLILEAMGYRPRHDPAYLRTLLAQGHAGRTQPHGAPLGPHFARTLRRVISVVEELHADGIPAYGVELVYPDEEPTIHIDADGDLDGDHVETIFETIEVRTMAYRGCKLEWVIEHPPLTCIGCGCTDVSACVDLQGETCAWIRKDEAAKVGVCTCCEAYVRLWDEGLRRPVTLDDSVEEDHEDHPAAAYVWEDTSA